MVDPTPSPFSVAALLDNYIGTGPIGKVAFPTFRWISESKVRRLVAVVALGLLLAVVAFTHVRDQMSWPWQASIIMACLVGSHFLMNVPFSLVSRCLTSQQLADEHLGETLAQVTKEMPHVHDVDQLPVVVQEMIDAIASAKAEDVLHLLTPSPVYLSVDRFIKDARSHFPKGSPEIQALEAMNGSDDNPLSMRFREALKTFRGTLKIVELDRRSASVRAACDKRLDALLGAHKPLRKAYLKAWQTTVDEIEDARRKENLGIKRYRMMAFPRVRFLLVGRICYAQELPPDRLGILGRISRHGSEDPEDLVRNIRRFLEMCETRTG